MSIISLIMDIYANTNIIGSDKQKIEKIQPKYNNENQCDLELGDGERYRKQADFELYSKPQTWDLEKCNNSMICGEIVMNTNQYDKHNFIKNYVSFMDIINYFANKNK